MIGAGTSEASASPESTYVVEVEEIVLVDLQERKKVPLEVRRRPLQCLGVLKKAVLQLLVQISLLHEVNLKPGARDRLDGFVALLKPFKSLSKVKYALTEKVETVNHLLG